MLDFIRHTWSDLLAFLSRPFDRMDASATTSFKVKRLFAVLGFDLAGALIIMLLIAGITELDLVDLDDHAVAEGFAEMSMPVILLLAVMVGPLFEELIFRLPLRYETNVFMGIARLFRRSTPGAAIPTEASLVTPPPPSPLRVWWNNNYRWIFYLTAAIFAYVHLANFDVSTAVLLFSPILVAAQFWMGLLGGFLRVRYGFVWTFLLHALHNLILVGGALLGDGPTEVIAVDNDAYHLRIEEASPFNSDLEYATFTSEDSLAYVNYGLDDAITSLVNETYSAVDFPSDKKSPRINIYYGRKNGQEDRRTIILDALREEFDFSVRADAENPNKASIIFE